MIQVKTQVVLIESEDKKERKVVIKTIRFLGFLIFKKESPLGM